MSFDAKIFCMCDHCVNGKRYIIERCPRCLSKGYYYDIMFDRTGKAILISGTLKLQQEVLKIINDEKGNNVFFPQWGSELHNLVGSKITKSTNLKLQVMIRFSLEYLRALQLQQQKEYGNVTNDEIILGVQSLTIDNYILGFDVKVVFNNNSNTLLEQSILL